MSKLTVHLVTWNGLKYVPYLFESLRKQTYKDWQLIIIDNDSKDGMAAAMEKEVVNFPVSHKLIKNAANVGFAPAHNQAIRETDGQYFLLLNQDMYLAPDCLQTMVDYLDEHKDVAAVSPRLMKWDFANVSAGLQASLTNQIDALGLKIFRNRRVIEQYTQQDWNEVKKQVGVGELTVFGVSGAFPMYRRSTIDQIAFSDGSMFDETYHSYKEDVDLAYRLTSAGFKAMVLLGTFAHHDRSGAGPLELNDKSAADNKKKQSSWVKYHSYKNHFRTLYKNEYWPNILLDFPWILWYELKKFIYFILFDRAVLKGLGEIWKTRRVLKQRRIEIKSKRKLSWRQIRRWWQ